MKSISSWSDRQTADLEVLQRFKTAIKEVVPNCDVVLYGSRARGDAREYSDYDILVLIDGPVDMKLENVIRSKVYPLKLETDAVITLLIESHDEWSSYPHRVTPFYENVEREGVIL